MGSTEKEGAAFGELALMYNDMRKAQLPIRWPFCHHAVLIFVYMEDTYMPENGSAE